MEAVNTASRIQRRFFISFPCHWVTEQYALFGLVKLGYGESRDHM